MRARAVLIAVAAGLALADSSVVTLALPELLHELHTTVEGVAAVLGVYTVVLALALLPCLRLLREAGPARLGAAGLALFAVAGLGCALSGSLGALLVARGAQALGGAAALVASFSLLADHGPRGRRLWLGAAVLASAAGPALGGALTQALSWQAIFYAQVPIAAAAALACLGARDANAPTAAHAAPTAERMHLGPAAALALVSAALTAVLFLLVLLLVAGWNVSPLRAAAAVSILPVAALAGARVKGDPRARAAGGSALVGGGVLALAFLPDAHLAWTLVPQAAAGLGMGLALPALAGELLPERDAGDAARLLTLRHAGIALALAILAPVIAANLDDATERARERGVALVLDAKLPPLKKLSLAPDLLAGVDEQRPRAGLEHQIAEHRGDFAGEQRATYDRLGTRADETLVTAVGEAFRTAFLVTGALALLGALAVLPRRGIPAWLAAAAAAAAVALPLAGAALHAARAPDPVVIRDPCQDRPLPRTGGVTGFLQDRALELLDSTACRLGSSREELVLALADKDDARRFRERHGTDPRDIGSLLSGLLG